MKMAATMAFSTKSRMPGVMERVLGGCSQQPAGQCGADDQAAIYVIQKKEIKKGLYFI